jgi:hypothetical protein
LETWTCSHMLGKLTQRGGNNRLGTPSNPLAPTSHASSPPPFILLESIVDHRVRPSTKVLADRSDQPPPSPLHSVVDPCILPHTRGVRLSTPTRCGRPTDARIRSRERWSSARVRCRWWRERRGRWTWGRRSGAICGAGDARVGSWRFPDNRETEGH